jgi:Flp pilus assembly protein TadG
MVEFGMVFVLFILLVILTVDGGRMVWSWVTLSHGVRQGARVAMVHGENAPVEDSTIEDYVKSQCPGLDPDLIQVELNWADSGKARGSQVSIGASYHFTASALPWTGYLNTRSNVTVAY